MSHRLHPLDRGSPAPCATAWGEDAFGVFQAFEVAGVTQRLRWIPPGSFWMGSPEGEVGRWADEGPRHLVTLSEGHWLAETPCTQALFAAVMEGANPSRFLGPTRPVDSVAWHHVQTFLERLNDLVPGLSARLPTEAEWEYACRAGTEGATYGAEARQIVDRVGAALDDSAWYGENAGHETHDVAGKRPNPWQLFDMLGNVWEWCADGTRTYTRDAVVDPVGPRDGRGCVVRGGSWFSSYGSVRPARRFAYEPAYRVSYVGFRIARGQGPAEPRSAPAARPARPPRSRTKANPRR